MRHNFIIILLLSLFCCNNYAQDKSGYHKGKKWNLYINTGLDELYVDGKEIAADWGIYILNVGNELYFTNGEGGIINIDGEKLFPNKYSFFTVERIGNTEFLLARLNDNYKDLYTSNLQLVVSNLIGIGEVVTDGKYGELFIARIGDNNNQIRQGLFSTSGDCIIPAKYKSINWTIDDDDNIATFEVINDNDYIGIMDRDKNWIVPLSKQFTKVTPSEISGKKYFICIKKGYWGLYDAQFNEVIAPDYEDLVVFDDTNFIKYKLNGFWGVMTLLSSTNTTKTIIPTTRGYTNIGRYIKSQKRFTYEMDGYKGECNHLGQQVSKIRIGTSAPPASKKSNNIETTSSQKHNSDQKIVIEHKRDPVPVQVWKQCTICMGSGKCNVCGGTGMYGNSICRFGCGGNGRCTYCAGKGGVYEVEYR